MFRKDKNVAKLYIQWDAPLGAETWSRQTRGLVPYTLSKLRAAAKLILSETVRRDTIDTSAAIAFLRSGPAAADCGTFGNARARFCGMDGAVGRIGRMITVPVSDGVASWVVPLRAAGTRPPLFFACVCAGGGDAFDYRDLALALPDDQPVYAFGVTPLAQGAAFPTVVQRATTYAYEVRRLQPHGPYYLSGHSFNVVDRPPEFRRLPTLGWQACIGRSVEVHLVPVIIACCSPAARAVAGRRPGKNNGHHRSMTIGVSIVIPTFRRPRGLREAIESVPRQDEVSLEIARVALLQVETREGHAAACES